MIKNKWLVVLSATLLMLGLYSCDKNDSLQDRNYLTEPFSIKKVMIDNQVFDIDTSEYALVIEHIQSGRQVGYINKEDISEQEINRLGFEITFVIDPKKYDVEFEFGEANIVNRDLSESLESLQFEHISTVEEREYAFVTYKVETGNLEEAISKDNFKHASFLLKSDYKEKKGKKKVEPRSMRFMVYAKS